MTLVSGLARRLLGFASDRHFASLQYWWNQRRWPDLDNPRTFNEKLQWLKLYYRDPQMVTCADKFAVREFVRARGSEDLLIPLLGVYDRVNDVPFDSLPNRFVIKATHGSGWNIVCRDKNSLDVESARRRLRLWLRTNFYKVGREWAYKEVPPRLVCEEFLSDAGGNSPPDYKVFCFNGQPRYIQVDYDRFSHHTRNMYGVDWDLLPLSFEYPRGAPREQPPELWLHLLEAARKLAAGFPFVRVDLYAVRHRVYFGEMTFYPEKGVGRFRPADWDLEFGKHLDLRATAAQTSGPASS